MKCGWAQCAQLPRAASQNTVWLLTWLSAAATVRKLGATFLRSLPLITDQVQVRFPYKCFVFVSKHPEMNHILYNFYSVSTIKVRICGQEYETRLLSRQKWKQWKSKRRNDCSFNSLKALWANVIIPSAFCWDCRISRDYCSIFYVFFKTISNFWVLSIFYFLYLENITVIKLSDKIINIYLHKNMLFMFIPSST